MATDVFMKFDGITGESLADGHAKEIDVLSWSWGASQAGTAHYGGGAAAARVSVNDLSFAKYVDRSSPTLLQMCCTGGHIKNATLVCRKAGGKKGVEYLKIVFDEVLISGISVAGSGDGGDRLTETISLNFAKFSYVYTPQKADGSGDAAITTTFDISKNIPV